jgi:signal transduction histidine kinase
VLLNLLINAVRASPEGSDVTLEAEQGADYTCFVITDAGPGMPEDLVDYINNASDTPPMIKGKGLGLWMISRLLEDLHGDMKIVTRSREGTSVTVRLPVGPIEGS